MYASVRLVDYFLVYGVNDEEAKHEAGHHKRKASTVAQLPSVNWPVSLLSRFPIRDPPDMTLKELVNFL